MKIKANKAHMEIIFPVVLFLVFTLSALFIILYAARTYQHIVEESNSQYNESVALNYICQKVHASDQSGQITVGTFNNMDAIIIRQTIDNTPYVTYIYAYDGKLMELFKEDNGEKAAPTAGTSLFEVGSFSVNFVSEGLLSFTISKKEHVSTKYISVHSYDDPTTHKGYIPMSAIEIELYEAQLANEGRL